MGLALFFVFDRPAGFDTFVNGKAIASADERLTALAHQLAARPLSEFFSMSQEEYARAAEDFDLPEEAAEQSADEQWFAPDEVLETVRALSTHIKGAPKSVSNAADVLEELAEYEAVLLKAKEAGLKCHLSFDI